VSIHIERLRAVSAADLEGLAQVLVDCVARGASVSFMAPLSLDQARAWWSGIAAEVARGDRILLVARDGAGCVGTVQLVVAQPPNQPHRADLAKMLVHGRARRQGVGAALLQAAEAQALQAGRPLLVLDTASPEAERLYERGGWQRCGFIPNYALLPDGRYCGTRLYFKQLAETLPAWPPQA